MSGLIHGPWVAALAWALLHFIWQGAAIGAAALLLQRLARQVVTRHTIGVAALVAMLAAFGGTVTYLTSQEPRLADGSAGLRASTVDVPHSRIDGTAAAGVSSNLVSPASQSTDAVRPGAGVGFPAGLVVVLWLALASRQPAPGVAIAATSGSLLRRVRRILGDAHESRGTAYAPALALLCAATIVASLLGTAPARGLRASGEPGHERAASARRAQEHPVRDATVRWRESDPRAAEAPGATQVPAVPQPAAVPAAVQTATLRGRVLGPAGEPMSQAFVRLLEWREVGRGRYLYPVTDGERVWSGRDLRETDAAGQFVFDGLPPGTYFLVALPEPFARDSFHYLFPPMQGPIGYAPSYFPAGSRAADARPIDARGGETIDNLAIAVPRVQTGSIEVEVIPANARSMLTALSEVYFAPGGDIQPAIRMQRRSQATPMLFEHLPVGEYVVSNDPLRRATVRANEVTRLSLLARVPMRLRATVSADGPAPPPSPATLTLRFERVDEFTGVLFGWVPDHVVRPDEQGGFAAPLLPVPTVLRVEPPPDWTFRRVMLNGHDITGKALDFTRVAEGLEIVLARRQ